MLVLIPLRRRQMWAWWACWALMIATVGYSLTIARHDPTILARSLIAIAPVPLLLVLCAPAVLRNPASPPREGPRPSTGLTPR